jgi:predicted TIM-barrel fold metal-dependent hydrolase
MMAEQAPFKLPVDPIVDVHTHMYPPPYIDLLKSRDTVPYIRSFPENPSNLRLIILPGEDSPETPSISRGRPVGPSYWDLSTKIAFMDAHRIDISVLSLANPWLDFVTDNGQAVAMARQVNDWFDATGEQYAGRLFAFGVLPMNATVEDIQAEIRRLKDMKWIRGVVMGTSGRGKGLDDPSFVPVWETLAETETMVFLHPHYGLPSDLYGPENDKYGHVLPLALGFPLETTIAITRMILSGIFARLPKLRILLAHSGGALPFLAGRIQSCIEHDAHMQKNGEANIDVWEILERNIFLDAVIYSKVGLKAAVDAVSTAKVMFGRYSMSRHIWRHANIETGTDHPFFPPLDELGQAKWASVETNYKAISEGVGENSAQAVLGGNAVELLHLRIRT